MRKNLFLTKKFLIIAIIGAIAVFSAVCWFLGGLDKSQPVVWGGNFSTVYAKNLGLDWQKTYLAMLDDLNIRHLRVPVYWTEVEPDNNDYFFSEYDFIVSKAQERDVKLILAVGQKLPRWPECFLPDWARNKSVAERELEILEYEKKVIERYRESGAVEAWQIENEPFFNAFGGCPKLSKGFIVREIALAREIDDSRKIILTDSGEWGFWVSAASKADIFGSTLYRQVWNKFFGYFSYPLPKAYYRIKSGLARMANQDLLLWDVELQAEPWSQVSLTETDVEKQLQLMTPGVLKSYANYAAGSPFERHYLWGIEWWYWMRDKNKNSEILDAGRQLFEELGTRP